MASDYLYWESREEGIDDLEAFFEYAGYKARDMREPLGKTRDYITATIAGQFLTEGALRSGGWVPLEEHYELWKLAHGGGNILELDPAALHGDPGTPREAHMREALLDPAAWTITMQNAEYDPPSTRAAWHQSGAERTRGGLLPPRPVLDLNDFDYEMIEEIFIDWLDELRDANIRRGPPGAGPIIFS